VTYRNNLPLVKSNSIFPLIITNIDSYWQLHAWKFLPLRRK